MQDPLQSEVLDVVSEDQQSRIHDLSDSFSGHYEIPPTETDTASKSFYSTLGDKAKLEDLVESVAALKQSEWQKDFNLYRFFAELYHPI